MAQVGVPCMKSKAPNTSIDKRKPMKDNPLRMLLQMIGLFSFIYLLLLARVPQSYGDAHETPKYKSIIAPGIHGIRTQGSKEVIALFSQ